MADVPNRIADLLRRQFDQKGAVRANLTHDVIPVFSLQEEAPHLAYLRDERTFIFQLTQAAGGAGTYARFAIAGAPFGTQRLTVITDVYAMKATAGSFAVLLDVPSAVGAFGTMTVGAAMDRRAPPSTLMTFGDTPAVLSGVITTTVLANTMTRLIGTPVILPPLPASGNVECLKVQNATVVEGLTVQVVGYTVPLHGGEEV